MEINKNVTGEDLKDVFKHLEIISSDLGNLAKEIFTVETDKKKLSKPSMYAFSIINRAVALNKGFLTLTESNNYVAAINFLRLQCDNCMRFHALSLVADRAKFFDDVEAGIHIRQVKSLDNKPMTDNYLCEKLDRIFPGFKELYKNSSGLIHFSNSHFHQNKSITVENDNIKGIILFNGENFLSLAQKVDYSYNLYLVSVNLYKLIYKYSLHVKDIMEKY